MSYWKSPSPRKAETSPLFSADAMLAAFLPEAEVVETLLVGFISPTAATDTEPLVGTGVGVGVAVGEGEMVGVGVGVAVDVGVGVGVDVTVGDVVDVVTTSCGRLAVLEASFEL